MATSIVTHVQRPIFVCYRQADEPGYVARLCDDLRTQFSVKIIRDRDYFKGGESWSKAIEDAIESSSIVLAVVGKDWQKELEQRNKHDDEVKRELGIAKAAGIPVLPVLLNQATLPDADTLGELRWLLSLHHRTLIDGQDRWPTDIEALVQRIRQLTGVAPISRFLGWRTVSLASLLGIVLLFIAYTAIDRHGDSVVLTVDRHQWVLNWNKMEPEFPYDRVRHAPDGAAIVSSDRLIGILNALSLPLGGDLERMRDALIQKIMTTEKVDTEDYDVLVGFEAFELDVDYRKFEQQWSDFRATIKDNARKHGVALDGARLDIESEAIKASRADCDALRISAKKTGLLDGSCTSIATFLVEHAADGHCEVVSSAQLWAQANCS